MPDYQKDTPRQAALRREIETHAIWQYPPEERLQHNREWQSLYLLVFEFKNFLQKIEHRLQNTDASALAQDEEAMLDARYTRRSQLRGKLDTLTFTQAMRTAVAKFDTTSGKEFLAYFDAIYSNTLHENVNKQANRDQGDIGLSSRRANCGSGCWICATSRAWTPAACQPPFISNWLTAWAWTRTRCDGSSATPPAPGALSR